MKKLYVIDYWVPFPSSEYGGLVVAVAENDAECYEILIKEEYLEDSRYFPKAMEAIKKARVFNLVENLESHVVERFVT